MMKVCTDSTCCKNKWERDMACSYTCPFSPTAQYEPLLGRLFNFLGSGCDELAPMQKKMCTHTTYYENEWCESYATHVDQL